MFDALSFFYLFSVLLLKSVQLFQPQAREKAEKEGFEVSIAKTSFKANTKALAENEGEGMAKVTYIIHNKLIQY